MNDLGLMPELQRPVIKALLLANKPEQAMILLKRVLPQLPSATPYWLEFATALAALEQHDTAVSALVVAHNWVREPLALLQAYEHAARETGTMGRIYRQASDVIKANTAAWDDRIAAVASASVHPITAPRADMTSCSKPIWPRTSLRFEETGTVTLMFLVDAAGKVVNAKVVKSSGHFELDHAALVGVSQCAFNRSTGEDSALLRKAQMQYVWTLE